MRRSAGWLTILGLTLAVSGCGLFKKKPEATMSDTYDPSSAATNPYPTETESAYTASSAAHGNYTSSGRTHTVQKKETLYSLARVYYNDQSKWRVIYDANRADIGEDPNKIRVGQKLVIP